MSQNIWILTIGSSDVQLKTKSNWTKLFRAARSQLDDRGFNPVDGIEGRFQVPARVMGVVYSQPQAAQNFDDLVFPLIDNFISISEIKDQPINKIILVLGDQSIFKPAERSSQNHAYWQDTCTLQPLLEKYLNQKLKNSSPDLQFQSLFLKPTSTTEGLDDWNGVLRLVQDEFSSLEFPDDSTIYVSHQAGTPAISSAIQFTSLSRFGEQVKFLVSNERDANLTKILPSSEYLKDIRKQEAKKLLERHDYSGVKDLISPYLDNKQHQEIKTLLEAAIQWNFAKFDEFANELQKLSDQDLAQAVKARSQQWWWMAYESAYLAIIRLNKQKDEDSAKDTVDALFHSFRAIEGAFSEWGAQHQFKDYIEMKGGRPWLQTSILNESHYFERAKYKCKDGQSLPDNDIAKLQKRLIELKAQEEKSGEQKGLIFYGLSLYPLFREVRKNWKIECKSIGNFWDSNNGISEKRNRIFHQLQGLTEDELFETWEVKNYVEWKERMRVYLNYVTGQSFQSLDEASLMSKVHQALESAIAHL